MAWSLGRSARSDRPGGLSATALLAMSRCRSRHPYAMKGLSIPTIQRKAGRRIPRGARNLRPRPTILHLIHDNPNRASCPVTRKRVAITPRLFVCGGQLVACHFEADRQPGYANPPPSRPPPPREPSWVEFRKAGRTQRIAAVKDLLSVLESEGASLASEVPKDPTGFTWVIADLLDLRRVVDDLDLWSFLHDAYGVSVEECLPRIEGTELRFTTCRHDWATPSLHFNAVVLNLVDGSTHATATLLERKPFENTEDGA
jgi:hypothetical protein